MPLNIRDEAVNQLAEKLATVAKVNKTEAVRIALVNELDRLGSMPSLEARLEPLLARIAAVPDTGLPADKAFYDDLNGEP